MRKIIVLVLCLFLTGCGNDYKDPLFSYINDELHEYTFVVDVDWDTYEETQTNKIDNNIATAILLLEEYKEISLEELCIKNDKTLEEVTDFYTNREIDSVYTGFNMILVYEILDLDLSELKTYFNNLSIDDLGIWDYTTVINCLNMLKVNTSLKSELENKLINLDLDLWGGYFSADNAAMIMVALNGKESKDYYNYILSNVVDNSIVNYTGVPSCSSTAQASIAFLSQGIIYRDSVLSNSLLKFKNDIGFNEYLNDDIADLKYASPQAFLALAVTYVFEEDSFVSLYR